jgi:hypothetical protein
MTDIARPMDAFDMMMKQIEENLGLFVSDPANVDELIAWYQDNRARIEKGELRTKALVLRLTKPKLARRA